MGRSKIDTSTQTKNCEQCGEVTTRRRSASGQIEPGPTWRKRRFCSPRCAGKDKQQPFLETISELEHIIGTDNPESIAKRLGYAEPKSLLKALRRAGRYDLSQRFGREFERFMAPLAPEPELSPWYA